MAGERHGHGVLCVNRPLVLFVGAPGVHLRDARSIGIALGTGAQMSTF